MTRASLGLAAASVLLLAACNESTTGARDEVQLSSAFSSVPAGFDGVQSSYTAGAASDGTGGPGGPWMPHGRGGPGGPGMGGLMGGGLSLDFVGDVGIGRGAGHGPFGGFGVDANCVFAAATGSVTCGPTVRDGLTITRVASYQTTAGVPQSKPDSTTNFARERITVTGTRIRRDSATSLISNSSDRTVTGLAYNAIVRTVNGTSIGSESTTGTSDKGAFTSTRIAGDTTTGLSTPIVDGRPTYPTAGTVIRSMKVTVSIAGATPTVSTRREVVTYNGTASATLVITQDGATKNCTLALPHGRPACQ
ncbi:MAG: hypothetical protein ABJC26_03525 [Gemmatimonadaceae bacterium]